MIVPIFNLKLNHRILPKTVTVGKYDGKHPCITAATIAGKVFIHNPYASRGQISATTGRSAGSDSDVELFNINQAVSCVCAGRLDPKSECDVLVVGSKTNVLAYNVKDNSDLFYNEVPDGASAIVIGRMGTMTEPLAIVGGSCSIQGYDKTGEDRFWTVSGDNVCSLALCDFDADGSLELVVGSEDFDIRVFKGDEIMAEMTETEVITCLHSLYGSRFGYALANGTVGVYDRTARYWRIKSKNQPVSIFGFDLNADGVTELITGWSNGKIDARGDRTGDVVFRDSVTASVAGITAGDLRQDGSPTLICCSVEGEIKGFQVSASETKFKLMDNNSEQELIRELTQKRQNLLLELKNYEENAKIAQMQRPSSDLDKQQVGAIPANTKVETELKTNPGSKGQPAHIELIVSTTNETVIRSVLVFAEGIFQGESFVMHPAANKLSPSLSVPLMPPKDLEVELHVKVLVGYKNSQQFHVFEVSRPLPFFSMYAPCKVDSIQSPEGFVQFTVSERTQRFAMWINHVFLLVKDISGDKQINCAFLSLRGTGPLVISMDTSGQVTIRTDSMDLAGDMVQSIATFLNLDSLQVTADFPKEMAALKEIIAQIDDYNAVRQRLSAEMADHSNIIRSMVVRAEDARMMGDMKSMRTNYMRLYDLNKDLISNYNIRCSNHQELLNCLKTLNQSIQKAGRLRVGKYQSEVVNASRAAIKQNNVNAFFKIIRTGSA